MAPLRHGIIGHTVLVVVATVVVAIVSQRIPVYWDGQIQEQEEDKKKPPFEQASNPHLQMGWLHIFGQ